MRPEVIFPYATGAYLLLASLVAFILYKRSGFKPMLIFFIGILAVAIESFLDGYEASRLYALAGGEWDALEQSASGSLRSMLLLDAVRGVFILIWAAAEVLFTAELIGTEKKLWKLYAPAAIIVVGSILTFLINFSGIEPLSKRILISSAVRVVPILIPVPLIAGTLILAKLWRPTGSRSLLLIGMGFIIHGATLPFYTPAKAAGTLLLGLWYAFGGLIPVTALLLGLYLAVKEAQAAQG